MQVTPESARLIDSILSATEKRNSSDISVVGHADTAGDEDYNLKISQRRALAVGSLLVEQGVQRDFIRTTSHGEGNPLIKTEDNVSEPRNCRVEVVVR